MNYQRRNKKIETNLYVMEEIISGVEDERTKELYTEYLVTLVQTYTQFKDIRQDEMIDEMLSHMVIDPYEQLNNYKRGKDAK